MNAHRDELDILLHDKLIDIALITETHFTGRSNFYIPDYTIYRADHPDDTVHGGAAILIRSSLDHRHMPLTSTDIIQATAITIECQPFSFKIAATYCPPNKPFTSNSFQTFFDSLGHRFLVGGDFNSKHPQWGCRVGHPRGRALLDAVQTKHYTVISLTDRRTGRLDQISYLVY